MTDVRPITLTSDLERTDNIGNMLLKSVKLKKDDMLILHSVSGRNNVAIEMAITARELGAYAMCITSVGYSSKVTSRHPSKKRLFEVCDLVIDNKSAVGDGAVKIPQLDVAMGPTSTVCGCALINGIVIEAVEKLIESGIVPPVYMSANLDEGDEHNKKIFAEYKDQIKYM